MYVKGMKVKISAQGHEKHGVGITNPKDTIGICAGLEEDADACESWYSVNWSNGAYNNYEAGDLDIIEQD